MRTNYTYDTGKKNAVVQVENSGNLIPKENVDVTYNAFNKVATVVQGTNTLTITYGPDRQRTKTVLVNGSNTTTTLYADNYEQRTVNGTTTTYHYVASPDGLAAVYVKKNGTTTPYYVETDHLGSIINLFDASGTKQFSATYDAWGKQTITKNAMGLTRGYTGHEHWNVFGLIDKLATVPKVKGNPGRSAAIFLGSLWNEKEPKQEFDFYLSLKDGGDGKSMLVDRMVAAKVRQGTPKPENK